MPSNGKPPKGWHCKRLDEVADIRFSSVDKHIHSSETPVRVCNYMDVWKNPYIHSGLGFMDGSATQQEIERFALQLGDVLLTKDSETKDEIAEPSVVKEHIDNLVLGYHLALLRPNESQALGAFLAAQLRIPEFRAQFIRAASGATRYGLSMGTVASAQVWLPKLDVQRRIVEILRATDDAIERTRAVIGQTRELKTALLQDLLTNGLPGRHQEFKSVRHVGRIPACWKVVPLAEVAVQDRGSFSNGPFGSDLLTSEFVATGVPVLYIQDIRDAVFRRVTDIYVTQEKANNLPACNVRPGDILVAKVGDPPCTAVVYPPTEPEAIITQDVIRLRVDTGKASPVFIAAAINAEPGRRQVDRILITGTRDRVSLGDYKKAKTILPPLEEQLAIENIILSVERRVVAAAAELSGLVAAKSAISQALLTGRVRVPVKGGR